MEYSNCGLYRLLWSGELYMQCVGVGVERADENPSRESAQVVEGGSSKVAVCG
jgi:hypothetical protein